MGKFNLATALGILPVVGPVIAAAPEFKKLWDGIVATFDSDADQATLKDAYALAIDDRDAAHADLQKLVAERG